MQARSIGKCAWTAHTQHWPAWHLAAFEAQDSHTVQHVALILLAQQQLAILCAPCPKFQSSGLVNAGWKVDLDILGQDNYFHQAVSAKLSVCIYKPAPAIPGPHMCLHAYRKHVTSELYSMDIACQINHNHLLQHLPSHWWQHDSQSALQLMYASSIAQYQMDLSQLPADLELAITPCSQMYTQ